MGKACVLAACVVALGCLPALAQEAMDLEAALALFDENGTIQIAYSDDGRAQLEGMIAAFRAELGVADDLDEASEDAVMAFDLDESLIEVMNRLSQAYYTLADAFLEGEDDERPTYLKGKHWGLKSLRVDASFDAAEKSDGIAAAVAESENLFGLYWGAANWLRAAQFNPLEAVFAGVPEKTEKMSLRCLELDPKFTAYGSYRALAAFWAGLPKLPAGNYRKNWSRSLGYFCHIVDEPEICADWNCDICPPLGEFDPAADEYFENRLFFVEFYLIERGMWADAKRILDEVLSEEVGDLYPLYNTIAQEKALAFLAEVEEHL